MKVEFDFDSILVIAIIILCIFVCGVQVGIKHGRNLQLQEMYLEYGYTKTN